MTETPSAPTSPGRTAAWIGGGIVLAAVLFAPLLQGGYCADSIHPDPALSYCETWERSVLGIDTNVWLWVGATIALGTLGWLIARMRRDRGRA